MEAHDNGFSPRATVVADSAAEAEATFAARSPGFTVDEVEEAEEDGEDHADGDGDGLVRPGIVTSANPKGL